MQTRTIHTNLVKFNKLNNKHLSPYNHPRVNKTHSSHKKRCKSNRFTKKREKKSASAASRWKKSNPANNAPPQNIFSSQLARSLCSVERDRESQRESERSRASIYFLCYKPLFSRRIAHFLLQLYLSLGYIPATKPLANQSLQFKTQIRLIRHCAQSL